MQFLNFRSIIRLFALTIIAIFMLLSIWVIWERNQDPVWAINFPSHSYQLSSDSLALSDSSRSYRLIRLNSPSTGKITAFLSESIDTLDSPKPVVIIVGGLEVGLKTFEYFPNPGNNHILLFRYPYSKSRFGNSDLLEVPAIHRSVRVVPSQIMSLIQWAKEQSWCDPQRVTIIGFSLGALFIPSIYHLANYQSVEINRGVMAYGGVDIYRLMMTNLRKVPEFSKPLISFFVSTATFPMEPARHLPMVNNELLYLNGRFDSKIPIESWQVLPELAPDPKTVLILETEHMHPKKPELTQKLVQVSKDWLVKRKVLNP